MPAEAGLPRQRRLCVQEVLPEGAPGAPGSGRTPLSRCATAAAGQSVSGVTRTWDLIGPTRAVKRCRTHSFTDRASRRRQAVAQTDAPPHATWGGPARVDDRSPSGRDRRPRPVDQRRVELRRRLGRAHRRHPAEHRGDRPRRPARAAEDRGALAADRLRVRARRRRRRLHRVVLQGRPRRARAVRARRRGLDPERGDQERGLLVRVRQQPRHRPADDDERVARPPRAEGARRARRRHLRRLRRHPRHGRQPDRRDGRARLPRLGLEVEGRPARSCASRAARPTPTTCPRRSSTCCTRRPARRR